MKNLIKKAVQYAKDNPEKTKAASQKAQEAFKKFSSSKNQSTKK